MEDSTFKYPSKFHCNEWLNNTERSALDQHKIQY